jgi:hypothetical protein
MIVNHFGLKAAVDLAEIRKQGASIIEDHTHDPWSEWAMHSIADYCLASLRKTLPIPDGAWLWSPVDLRLPDQPDTTGERERAALGKAAAMHLKTLYLQGHPVDKAVYRKMFIEYEAGIAKGEISGISNFSKQLAGTFPIVRWRERRTENHRAMVERLSKVTWLEILEGETDACAPFSAVVVFDLANRRERVLHTLIDHGIYPAVLWPLEKPLLPDVPNTHVDLSRRILSFHCDFRYNVDDMYRVADALIAAGESV